MLTRRHFLAATAAAPLAAQSPVVIHTAVADATKDKPQSKLWYAHASWWALLPAIGGPAVWKRTGQGWQRQTHLDASLRGLPGQADVVVVDGTVCAVLVEPDRLATIQLVWNVAKQSYGLAGEPSFLAGHTGIETATIAHAQGRLWVAYNSDRQMYVRTAAPKQPWTGAERVTLTAAKDDDICQVVAFLGGIGVIWPDQVADAVYLRRHNGVNWLAPETAAQGGNTADDHISTAVATNGTLYIATKNSVDNEGQPQQVLRIRSPKGEWRNLSYAPLTATEQPTRPIAQLSADERTLHLFHTVAIRGAKPGRSHIVHIATSATRPDPIATPRICIQAPAAVNNVTGAKQTAGLVVASDKKGNIYEASIR